jgi:hypothetical protein
MPAPRSGRTSAVATVASLGAETPALLRFDFDPSELSLEPRGRTEKPRSIKEALVRWLDQQL